MAPVYRRVLLPSGKPSRIKDDFTKTVAPTATDDLDGGWKPGSLWLDTVTGILYVAESVADGAAVWNAAGGATDHGALSGLSDDDHPQYVLHSELATAGHYEVLMTPGISNPPEPFETPDGTDWFYAWVPDA